MPDSYVNPDRKVVVANLKWFPERTPSTNGYVTPGWSFLTLVRGKFRNDYYVSDSDCTLVTSLTGVLKNDTGNHIDPINASFRKLQTPNKNVKTTKNPLIFQGSQFVYEISLNTANIISGIALTYAYVVDIFDQNLIGFMAQSGAKDVDLDIAKVRQYRANPTFNSIDVDWSKYAFIKIKAYTATDTDTTAVRWPSDNSELKASGFFYSSYESVNGYTDTYIRFANSRNKADFKTIKKIKIINDSFIDIKIAIKKIKLFNWGRVNLPEENLPCSVLSYAVPIDISAPVPTLIQSSYYPPSTIPFGIKLFCPDDTIASRGFAHAVDIHFLIAAFGDPFAFFFGFTNAWVFFIGPTLGKKTSLFYLDPLKSAGINGLLIRVNDETIKEWADRFVIQKVVSDTDPNDETIWTRACLLDKTGQITEINTNVKLISPFLIHDLDGNDKTWYRIIQINSPSGSLQVGTAFRGTLYTEKSLLNLNTTGISNASSLTVVRTSESSSNFSFDKDKPIAIFQIDNPDNFFTNNLVFKNGMINFAFTGKSYDPSMIYSSNVYVRIWFHPGSEEVSYEEPEKYRTSETEMIIQDYVTADNKNKSKIVFGTPTSFSDLIVSAPLLNDINNFNIIKYVNGLPDFNNNYSPFPGQSTVNLIVAVYVYSTLNGTYTANDASTINPPNTQITFSTNSTKLELPIIKNTTGTLAVSRFLEFNNVINSTSGNLICKLSNLTYLEDKINSSTYFEYNRTIQQIDQVNDPENYAYADLLSLRTESIVTPQKIVAKIPKYSLTDNNSVFYFIDFATNFNTFINTKVNQGIVDLSVVFDIDADNAAIINKVKVAGFFVSRYGKILERFFISNFEKLPETASKFSFNKTINLQIPFYISNGDCQIIIRVYYYPYSKSGIVISNDEWIEVKRLLNGKPDGLRIDDVIVTFSAGLFSTSQNIGPNTGTVNYEDLQLVPAQSLDSQDFWFVSQDQKLHQQYLSLTDSFKLQGAVYSPTWLIDLPKNMEVDTRFNPAIIPSNGQDITSANVVFRTVPVSKTAGDSRVSAIQSGGGNPAIHIAKTKPVNPFDVTTQSYATNTNSYIQLANPLYAPTFSTSVSGVNSVALKGDYPDLFSLDYRQGKSDNYGISISVQDADADSGFNKIAANGSEGYNSNRWFVPNSGGSFEQNLLTKFTSDLSKTTIAQDKLSKNIFAAGYAKPGSIIVKTFNLLNPGTIQSTNAQGQSVSKIISFNYLIDGESNTSATYDTDQSLVAADTLSGLNAVETFTGLALDDNGNALVAYVLDGENNKINARQILSTTKSITNKITIVNMGSISSSDLLNVFCPVVKYYNSLYHLVFFCAGKLFLSTFASLPSNKSGYQFPTNPVTLVAGNPNFDSDTNKAHPFLKELQNKNKILVKNSGTEEVDLKMQAAAFVVADNTKNRGQLFIYYTLPTGVTVGRQILFGGALSEPYKISD